MNIKKLLVSLFLLFNLFSILGQELEEEDLNSRNNAESIISNYLSDKATNKKHIIFSVSEKYFLVLVENIDSYEEIYLSNEEGIVIKRTKFKKPKDLFEKIFNVDNYKKGFINFNSDFFSDGIEISIGSVTYFVMKDELGKRYGESRLCMLIKPNPIDLDIHYYFTKRILEY